MDVSSHPVYAEEYFDGDESHLRSGYTFDRVYPYAEAVVTCLVETFDPGRALDVGCARGFYVRAFRRFGVEASGIDISEYAISTARLEDREFLFPVDIETDVFPFADRTFDLLIALHVLEHLQDVSLALSEMKRVLRRGGHVLVAVPTGEILKGRYDPTHHNLVSSDGWISLFHEYNLEPNREAQERFHLSLSRHGSLFRESCRNLYRHTLPSSPVGKLLRSACRGGDSLRAELGGWLLHSSWLRALEKSRGIFLLRKRLRHDSRPGASN